MLIKPLLILGLGFVLLYSLSNRNAMKLRAGKKVLLVLFVSASIVSILMPDMLNALAHTLGIGRGADLLLYLSIVAFIFVSLNIYLKFKDMSQRQAKIVRAMALLEQRMEESSK